MAKVKGIKEKNFEDFINKINEFNEDKKVFATQTHLEKGTFYAIIYYSDEISDSGASEQELATDKQKAFLQKLNFEGNVEDLTKEQARELITKLVDEKNGR